MRFPIILASPASPDRISPVGGNQFPIAGVRPSAAFILGNPDVHAGLRCLSQLPLRGPGPGAAGLRVTHGRSGPARVVGCQVDPARRTLGPGHRRRFFARPCVRRAAQRSRPAAVGGSGSQSGAALLFQRTPRPAAHPAGVDRRSAAARRAERLERFLERLPGRAAVGLRRAVHRRRPKRIGSSRAASARRARGHAQGGPRAAAGDRAVPRSGLIRRAAQSPVLRPPRRNRGTREQAGAARLSLAAGRRGERHGEVIAGQGGAAAGLGAATEPARSARLVDARHASRHESHKSAR